MVRSEEQNKHESLQTALSIRQCSVCFRRISILKNHKLRFPNFLPLKFSSVVFFIHGYHVSAQFFSLKLLITIGVAFCSFYLIEFYLTASQILISVTSGVVLI